jgi:hypothetical protein
MGRRSRHGHRAERDFRFRAAARVLGSGLAASLAALPTARAQSSEDRVTLRGAYFREASTRVIQPMVEVKKALPGGYDLGGHFLVDAISSASIAQGAITDEVFSENRYEGSLAFGWTQALTRIGAFVRYSREPDYFSHTAGLSATREVWERTGTVSLNFAFTHDDIEPRPPLSPRDLDVWFAGVSYAQVITPTTVAQAGYEIYYLDGFGGNVYISHPNLGREELPETRLRHALAMRVAQYLPALGLGAQLHYRFYFDQESLTRTDPWGMTAHTVEARLYKNLGRHVETRLAYRYHQQSKADFWCNSRADLGCYGMMPTYHSWDVKFGGLTTHLPELKLIWNLHVLERLPALGWLAGGAAELSYGYLFQSTPYGQPFTDKNAPPAIGKLPFTRKYGGAHLVQTGYSLPF